MRIVVTGATGFLGRAFSILAMKAGHKVIGLGRDVDKGRELERDGVPFCECDLMNEERMHALFGVSQVVVHCAALSSPWGRREDFWRANVEGTRKVVYAAQKAGIRRLVHVSTPSIYFEFRDRLGVKEGDPLPRPVNDYAMTKLVAEHVVRDRIEDAVIIRPRGIFGAGDTTLLPRLERVASKGVMPLFRGGESLVDLTHVDDVAQALLIAATKEGVAGTYNVSQGDPIRVRDLIETVLGARGIPFRWRDVPVGPALLAARAAESVCKLLPRMPEPPVTAYGIGLLAYSQTLDISAARDVLGWQPSKGIREALDLTLRGNDPVGLPVYAASGGAAK